MTKTAIPESIKGFLEVFKLLSEFIDETPPLDSLKRYGNKAYQLWYDKMMASKDKAAVLLFGSEEQAVKYSAAWDEIFSYYSESFGNRENISYGSAN